MTTLLGIDQSTSATKAVLVDSRGQLLDKVAREHAQIYPASGWVEHDADEIWHNLLAVVEELARKQPQLMADIAGVAITNQRETFVVFDRETGRPLHNAIVWQCRRGDPVCRELAADESLVQQRTGLKLDTYFPASKIARLMRDRADIADAIHSGQSLIGTIDAYLVYRLTRGQVFATDHTNASRTLLYNVHNLGWDSQLCDLFGVPMAALPEIRDCTARYGDTSFNGLLPNAVPICGVMGDSQAALFAQRCFEPGMAKATFGTGTSVLMNVGADSAVQPGESVLALAWVVGGKPTYALEGLINYSTATLTWLRDQLGIVSAVDECESLAIEVPDNGGVYLVPAFAGLSAPHWKPEARAALVGLTAHSCKAHVVRAALESVSFQIRDVLDMMHRESRIVPQVLHADGGPTCNRFLMQFTADMIDRELCVTNTPELSALGATFAGMLGLGVYDSLTQLAALSHQTTTYRPSLAAGDVDRLLAGWHAAVQRVL